MKKLLSTLLVAMFTMFTMSSLALAQVIGLFDNYFTITNKTTNVVMNVPAKDFSSVGTYEVNLDKGVYNGDNLEITYTRNLMGATPHATWTYSFAGGALSNPISGMTVNIPIKNVPHNNATLTVYCDYQGDGQSGTLKLYTLMFPNVHTGSRITVKNNEASTVQVTYADYEEVLSAGQRATVSLYDIYGNPVATGYLDNLGMGTLSTKGRSGIYIVKVMVNNQVIFNQRIQVK